MMNVKKIDGIEKIELGPRQIPLFGEDEKEAADQERVMNCLNQYLELHGQANILEFLPTAAERLELSEFRILQHLFWMVEDAIFQFRFTNRRIAPVDAKKILVESHQPNLNLVKNKLVAPSALNRAKQLFQKIDSDTGGEAAENQFEFAQCLKKTLRAWKNTLHTLQVFARKPGFPGKSEVDRGLALIQSLTVNLEAFCLVEAFLQHAESLALLPPMMTRLGSFYTDYAEQWQRLVEYEEAFQSTLSETIKEDIAQAYAKFKLIVASPDPYDRVEEALQLFSFLKPHHDQIVTEQTQNCRRKALTIVQDLITSMQSHLDKSKADSNLRNQSLYPLRVAIKKIQTAKSMEAIKRQRQTAEESFDLAYDALIS